MAEVLTYRGETLPGAVAEAGQPRATPSAGRQRQPVLAAPAAGTLTMRVLVTGGAGYVGSVSVERLVQAGHEVTVLDTLVTGHREVVVRARPWSTAASATGTCSRGRSRTGASRPCCIAPRARWSVSRWRTRRCTTTRTWSAASRSWTRSGPPASTASCSRPRRRCTASPSGSPSPNPTPRDPSTHMEPPSSPSRAPCAGTACTGCARWRCATSTWRAPARVNGEDHEPETHLIPNLLRAAMSGTPVTLFGEDYPTPDGTAIRDYIHVMDLADAHMLALEWTVGHRPARARRATSDRAPGSACGRCSPVRRPWSVGPSRTCSVPAREGDPPVLVAATDRAREVLGWTPARGSLEEMIGSAWTWMHGR